MASRRSGSGFDGGSGSGSSAGGSSSGLLSSNQVVFCVNPVLFENCGLLLDPPSGLTTASVMKLRQESANATSISLASWKELAVGVLGLREVTAYSLFDVFFALSGGCMQGSPSYACGTGNALGGKSVAEFRQESNRALLGKMGGGVDESRWPMASSSRQVSLPGLIIFLLTQLLLERPPRHALGEISQDVVVNNVRQYLHDYITAVAVTRPGRVTFADVLELRALLREFVNGVERPLGTSLGFLWPRNEKTIDIAILSQFIRPRIVHPNDLGSASGPGGGKGSPQQQQQLAKLFANNVILQGMHNRVVIPPPPPLQDPATSNLTSANCTIRNSTQSAFYVAAALPHTRLSQLSNCTVALGPVGGVLCIDRCQNCSVSALCGAVIVSNCANMQIFVCTNTPPVLLTNKTGGSGTVGNGGGSNSTLSGLENVRFAPYNSHYAALEGDLAISGISPKLNLWNAGLPSQSYILPPEEFTPIAFPVQPQVTTTTATTTTTMTRTNPCTLPTAYQEALSRRLHRFDEVSNDLRDAYTRLEEEGRQDLADGLRTSVQAMFMEWLQQSGQAAGLSELLHGGVQTGR